MIMLRLTAAAYAAPEWAGAISEAWRRLATLTCCDSHRPPGVLLLALRLWELCAAGF
jgi:hypothetical protein